MGDYIIAEILATVSHNVSLGTTILDCSQPELNGLSQEAKQQLAIVKKGLAMAINALNSEELSPWIEGEICDSISA